MSVDQYTDPLYSSSSSTKSNTPISPNLISTINNHNDYENISNIFEEILSQTNSDSIRYDHYSRYYHPYDPYSSFFQGYGSSMHPPFYKPYSYSSLRMSTSKRHRKRRKCYGCRQQGHIRKECPYFSHE
ncbi:unnamed protein product [Rotaria sp. Silwood2]|nr:unnamed protein product [Rotaria sp. Silwood2]CAF4701971.1 unnamed protein product [Rotaria sp. Silwood2]